MRLLLATLCVVFTTINSAPQQVTNIPNYTKLSSEEIRHLQNRGFGPTVQSFRPTVAYEEVEEDQYEDSEPESSQDRHQAYTSVNAGLNTYTPQPYQVPTRNAHPKVQPSPKPERKVQQVQQVQYRRGEAVAEQPENRLEEEEEKEEPDRLSVLLPQSRFNCNGKNTGYYADEDLGCEVFHYCQDNARHSWICPDGFTFHQVHLICMPPGGDNICEKSSDYHFVNDFLYKPINLEEHQQKPNISLRYSDRYFPETYRQRYEDEEEEQPHHQHSIRVAQPRHQIPSSTFRPQTSIGQVFRSPEEINISLQQRRPQYTTAKYEDY